MAFRGNGFERDGRPRRGAPPRRTGGLGMALVERTPVLLVAAGLAGLVFDRPRPGAERRYGPPLPNRAEPGRGFGLGRAAPAEARGSARSAAVSGEDDGRGRGADAPHEIPKRGWKDILLRTWEEMQKDRVLAIAAGVTFYALLALFPAIAAFVSIYGLFADPATVERHFADIRQYMPYGAADIIGERLKAVSAQGPTTLGFTTAFGILVSLWSANSGMKAVLDALNVAYEEEEKRSFLKLNAVSLAFTIGAALFLLLAIGAVVVVPALLALFPLGPVAEWAARIGRWVAIVLLLIGALALLYRYGPSRREPEWKWVSPGSILAAVLWVAASVALSIYAQNFANYDETYGSLGAVIGFMIWMWVSSTIIVAGAELNAEAEHQTARDSTEGGEKPMGVRGAKMADTVGEARG